MQTIVTQDEQRRVIELEKMKKSLEAQLREMTRKVELQEEQIAMAKRDPLTGLRNRAGIAEQINHVLKKENKGAFFIMDMDNFKSVNDTYGHLEGDKVLIRFAESLRRAIAPGDMVARLGGDEFIIFTPGDISKSVLREKAAQIVRRVERDLISPGRLVRVTISMGIAQAPEDGVTFEGLYTNSDKALYFVKNGGKNAFCFYNEIERQQKIKNGRKASLGEITLQLREKKMEGSFVVEYGSFEKIYRFMERNIGRENRQVQCVLFTINEPLDTVLESYELQRQMEHLEHAVTSSLRKGDVTSNYSSCQMLTLLMDVSRQDATTVIERIIARYREESGEGALEVQYDFEQLTPEQNVG